MNDVQNTEVQAEGATTLADVEVANIVETTPKKDTPLPKPSKPGAGKAQTKKNQTGAINARFTPVTRITAGESATLTWSTISIDPYTFSARGESFNLAWKRNLWQGGSNSMGYLTGLQLLVVISRPPQISGMLEFKDSTRGASIRYHVEFGGRLEFPVMTNVIANPVRPRHWSTPVVRTNEAGVVVRYRPIAFNRTADIAEVKVNVFARPGHATFHTPIKPKPRGTSTFATMARELSGEYQFFETLADDLLVVREEADDDPYLAPEAGGEPEEGAFDDYYQDDDIDQDHYWIRVWEGTLSPDQPVAIPLNLSVISDVSDPGSDETTINQKFERFAHVMPCEEHDGDLGPTIGEYVIHTRLPTGVAASLAHVCLPDDLSDEVALRIFGLSSILSMATSALAPLGGPLVSGLVNTVPKLIGNIAGGLLGGKPADSQPEANESAKPATIGGKIPLARFIQFLKPVAENLINDPTFATLAMQVFDLLSNDSTRAITSIPAAVFVKMRGRVERSLFNRTITPLNSIINETRIASDRFSYIVEEFGRTNLTREVGTRQNRYFKKFMGAIINRQNTASVSLQDIEAYELTEVEDLAVQSLLESQRREPISLTMIHGALKRKSTDDVNLAQSE